MSWSWSVAIAAILVVGLVGCPAQQAAQDVAPPPVMPAGDADLGPWERVDEEGEQMDWTITSSAFADGERMPDKYTCVGEGVSPPIDFGDVPEGTVELALICHDPDAPREGGWTHWVLWALPADVAALPEGLPTTEEVKDPPCRQGNNSMPAIGYQGACPPPGKPHRYQFTAYALNAPLLIDAIPDRDALLAAMEGKIIAQTNADFTLPERPFRLLRHSERYRSKAGDAFVEAVG